MNSRERLQEQYEDALLALMMEQYLREQGEQAWNENERLLKTKEVAVPPQTDKKIRRLILHPFRHKKKTRVMRNLGIAACFTVCIAAGAFTMSPNLRQVLIPQAVQEDAAASAGAGTADASPEDGNTQQFSKTVEETTDIIVRQAFGLDVADALSSDVSNIGDVEQTNYQFEDGKIVIGWADDEIPQYLYYYKNSNDTEEPEYYDYPDTILEDAQRFLYRILGMKSTDRMPDVYGYQNRIGVLIQAEDETYFHIQLTTDSNEIIGYQHFKNLSAAERFYQTQEAVKLDKYGLDFSEQEIQSAIAVAKKYYSDWANESIDKTMLSSEEASSKSNIQQWLSQGVNITYDKTKAYHQIIGTSIKDEIKEEGAGTHIILQVTVPACTEDWWKYRTIELKRADKQSDWNVVQGGEGI